METNFSLLNVAKLYRVYLNEYITVYAFAIDHGMTEQDALIVIGQGKAAHNAGY